MIIGFTGTRNGMTSQQWDAVKSIMQARKEATALHGDCVGADEHFDLIARDLGMATAVRPCTYENLRANTGSFEIAPPTNPMARNRAIIADADIMIACPPNDTEIKRGSGTWATIRYARKAGKPLYIAFPDGAVQEERTEAQASPLASLVKHQ